MSYILDALRRAESERERGQVPGLHAQPVPVGLGEGPGSRLQGRAGLVAGGAATLLLLGGLVWWWSRPTQVSPANVADAASPALREGRSAAEPAPMPAAPTAPPLLVAPPAPPAPPASPAPPPAAPAPRPHPATARAPAAGPAELAPAGDVTPPAVAPATALPTPPATPTQPTTPGAGRAPPGAAADATSPGTAGAAGGAKVIPLAELPSAQRAELPQMLIGGAIYSDQPSRRFVVINGLVVREGETAAPGVTLERIAPKSAVIRWRELRIELPI